MKYTHHTAIQNILFRLGGVFIFLYTQCFSIQAITPIPKDSLQTVYKNGTFQTYCQKVVNSSMSVADGTIDDFIGQFRGDPELLFEWALKDLGQQTDKQKDAVILVLKSTTFDSLTCIGAILTDIVVPGFTTFKDVNIDSKVTKNKLTNGNTRVVVDVYYSNSFLKKAYGTFYIKPLTDNKVLMTIQINIRFGWFFDIFITQRKYRYIAEWRVNGFVENMKKETEKRYQNNLSNLKTQYQ